VIGTDVPRSDYLFEVLGLVSLLMGAQGTASVEVQAIPTPGRHNLAGSGKGGVLAL
jgi:hypothetical protein